MRKRYLSIAKASALFVTLALCPVQKAQAASFDCTKATTEIEKKICADAKLSQLDEEVNKAYAKALKTTDEVEFLQQQQRDWLAARNRSLHEEDLHRQYFFQINLLRNFDWLENKPVAAINCAKAETPFERYFCDFDVTTYQGNDNGYSYNEQIDGPSGRLSDYDEKLQAVYAEALQKHFDLKLLHKEQLAWVRLRELCVLEDNCSNPTGLYKDRIYNLRYAIEHPPQSEKEKEIARLVSMGASPGENFAIKRGEATICQTLVRWLNYTTPQGDFGKGYPMIKDMPGISFPAWQELNIDQYQELFRDILAASEDPLLFGRLKVNYEQARVDGERLWMVKVKLGHQPDDKQQTLVWHRIPYTKSKTEPEIVYGDDPYMYGSGRLWVVNDDLIGVDRKQSRDLRYESSHLLLYYNGQPVFFSGYASHAFIDSSECYISNSHHKRSEK